jgi:hypothetical protein
MILMKFSYRVSRILKAGFRIRKYDFFVERFLKNQSGVKTYGVYGEIYGEDLKYDLASESEDVTFALNDF